MMTFYLTNFNPKKTKILKNKMNLLSSKEKIILTMTQDMKIFLCFVDNLKFLNFDVFLICNSDKNLKYKNLKDRLHNLLRKTFFNDRNFKERLFKQYIVNQDLTKLRNFPESCDYSLIIRADLFDDLVINSVIKKSKKKYSYQWDGLSRFPDIYKSISLFDRFYVFDKNDIDVSENSRLITNFYFDCYNSLFIDATPEYDVYFVGSFDSRFEQIKNICEFLITKDLRLKIIICGGNKVDLSMYSYITVIHEPLSYLENLKMIANSKMLIDFHHENLHNGLSFRSFEALGYNKKLITSNSIIKEYDFYNEKNIYVIDKDYSNFNEFLNKDYVEIDQRVKYKYSFTNWINCVLEKEGAIII